MAYSVWKSYDEVIIEGHAAAPDQAEAIIAEGLEKVAACSQKFISCNGLMIMK